MNQPLRIDLQKISDQQQQSAQRTVEQPGEIKEHSEFWTSDFAASGNGKGGGTTGSLVS